MLIEVLAGLGLVFIWIANGAMLYGFALFGSLLLGNMIARGLTLVDWIRCLVDVILFCAALFVVMYVMLGSTHITSKYFQLDTKVVGFTLNPPSVEVEKK